MTPEAKQIIADVALEFGVSQHMIVGDCRWRAVVVARAEVTRRLAHRKYSSPRIAAILGKDHTTILYYLQRGTRKLKLRPTDPQLTVPPLPARRSEMKLTPAQRDELMRLAAEGGYARSKNFAREIGCSQNYGLVLLQRKRPKKRQTKKWHRAIAIGPVLA
jgi:hypothetical protein